ncbi:hypothetical protein LDENG_00084010, partial [Lucifuga dentata]
DDVASAITVLRAHFTPTVNVLVERHAFRERVQGSQESIVQYIAALRELAATCDFSNTDDMIWDQPVEHVANPHIKESSKSRPDVSRPEAITMATQAESASEQAKVMTGDQRLLVHVVQTQNTARRRSHPRQGSARPSHKPASVSSACTCFHSAKAAKTVKLIVDTGASVSVLPQCIYEEHFKEAPLHQSSVQLVTYSQTLIKVLGCMQATGTTLMGRDLISALHLHIEDNTVYLLSATPLPPASKISVGYLTSQPASPATLGCAKGFMHK